MTTRLFDLTLSPRQSRCEERLQGDVPSQESLGEVVQSVTIRVCERCYFSWIPNAE